MNSINHDFSIIVATNDNSLMGIREYGTYGMPWPLIKEDMDFFRKLTTTTKLDTQVNACIIGHTTWLTLPAIYKKNKKRFNIVISRSARQNSELVTYVKSFNEALAIANSLDNLNEIYVIGGSTIYDIAMTHPSLKTIYMTHIKNSYPAENIIESEIYFPLTHGHFDELTTKNILTLANDSGDRYDITKNIHYCFREYYVNDKKLAEYYSSRSDSELFQFQIKRQATNQPTNQPTKQQINGEHQYVNLIRYILDNGIYKSTRNATTKSIFGHQLRFDLAHGYPISTVKKSYPKTIFEELMWMIRGQTNVKILQNKGVHIWDKNSTAEFIKGCGLSYAEGDIGPGYGFQMRHYGATYTNCQADYTGQGIDQLQACIDLINNEPHSRRIIINLWNPVNISQQTLPACHCLYDFTVDLYDEPQSANPTNPANSRGKLNCLVFQRSWDVMLGWNTTTAALLTYILANHCNLDPGQLVHSIADAHLYQEHIESGLIDELLKRDVRKYPMLKFLAKRDNINDYEFNDLQISDYYPCPAISANMVA